MKQYFSSKNNEEDPNIDDCLNQRSNESESEGDDDGINDLIDSMDLVDDSHLKDHSMTKKKESAKREKTWQMFQSIQCSR